MNNSNNICIDFGTCNSVVSYIIDEKISQLTEDSIGDVLIPTVIYFDSTKITSDTKISDLIYCEHYWIGLIANDLYSSNKDSEYYFYQFKRFLGITSRSINHYSSFLSRFNLDYTVDEDTIYFYLKCYDNQENKLKLSIIDLISLYFKSLYQMIKLKLNLIGQINCVITCPAYFHDLQRSQLKKASEDSGFLVNKIYNEPTAAAIYYLSKHKNLSNSNFFIIYDLGGGTIDTTVVQYHESDNTCEVIDIDGNNGLGGIDIDNLLILDIYSKNSIDPSNLKWKEKIRKIAEEIKIKLTFNLNYHINLEYVPIIKPDSNLTKIVVVDDLKISYSRNQFNNLISNIIDEMIKPIFNMYEKYQTNNIIFIGGPTQIPLLQDKVKSYLQSNIFKNQELNLLTTLDNLEKPDINLYKTIVSQGGSLLSKFLFDKKQFYLLEIIPMNIGISDHNNQMVVMIEKNSKIPLSIEKTFTTSHDCQRSIDIEIYEGIENNCNNNTFIGSYKIIGIPPLPKGMILIKLLFKISYNGILNISINGFKNPSDNSSKSFDFKMFENIKLISNLLAKDILKKIIQAKIKNN
jgi:molecular chaperone DnaK (HSP70)